MGKIIRGWRGMLGGAGLLASGLLAGCENTSPRSQGTASPGVPMVRNTTTTPAPAWNTTTQPNYASTTRPMGTGPTAMGSMTSPGATGMTGTSGMTSSGSMGVTGTSPAGMTTTSPGSTVPGMTNPASFGGPAPATGTQGSTLSPVSSLPTNPGVSQAGYATAQPTRLSAAPTYQTSGLDQSTSTGTALPAVPQQPSMSSSALSAPPLSSGSMPTMPGGR